MYLIYSLFILVLLTACTPSQRAKIQENNTPSFNPTNTYSVSSLPSHIHRVVCLPIFSNDLEWTTLEPINEAFQTEFIKTELFEVISLKRSKLIEIFDTPQFGSNGVFPADFIEKIKEQTQADALVLVDITHFRPYKPISIGVRAKLISLINNTLIWSFDCMFDAGDARVAIGAKRYQQRFLSQPYPLHESISILQSPRKFSHYVAFTTFQNLLRIQKINQP